MNCAIISVPTVGGDFRTLRHAGRVIVVAIILLACSSLRPKASAAEEDSKLRLKLVTTLNEFARKHKLSDQDLKTLVGNLMLNGQAYPKGGVGSISDNESYILLDEKKNMLQLAGKRWEGRNSNENELVIVDGQRVIGSVGVTDTSALTIVMFSATGLSVVLS